MNILALNSALIMVKHNPKKVKKSAQANRKEGWRLTDSEYERRHDDI